MHPYRTPSPPQKRRQFRALKAFTTFCAAAAMIGAVFVHCGAPQWPSGDGGTSTPTSWVSSVMTAMSILNTALPGAIAVVQALPVDPTAKQGIITGLQTAQAAIPGVDQALTNYQQNPSVANECVARAATQLVATSLLAVGDALATIGLDIPSVILVALGGLGSVIDELLPVCPSVDAGVSTQSIAAHLNARPHMDSLRQFPPLPRVAR
jgi:hypothetical protein